jgi:adenylate cyclase
MSEERVERRLAAILAADVVGNSRLIGADEERPSRRFEPASKRLNGRSMA